VTAPAALNPSVARGDRLGRLALAQRYLSENGLRWTAYAALFGGLTRANHAVYQQMVRLERRHALSGRNSVAENYRVWDGWDWSGGGEEWTHSEEWKQSLIDDVMRAELTPQTTILEIGPGGGRWTEPLLKIARHLVVVDLSDRCIEVCRQRFADAPNIEFHVNDGRTLPAVASESIDNVWSFDVFVHIAPPDIESYLAEIHRVLRPDGRAVIHHARDGHEEVAAEAGWRSGMTAVLFAEMVRAQGLKLQAQFDSWGPGGRFSVRRHRDTITVFTK
jgi:SAM-dependent methyltransferase